MIYFNDDPLTRVKRARTARQKQAVINLTLGLVLGGGLMNLLMELYKGVGV